MAWAAPFASRGEQIAWRVAAASVVGFPVALGPVALWFQFWRLGRGVEELFGHGKRARLRKAGRVDVGGRRGLGEWVLVAGTFGVVGIVVVSPLLWASYVLGRVYLVVECFVNLWHLPEGAFRGLEWPGYVPHIA